MKDLEKILKKNFFLKQNKDLEEKKMSVKKEKKKII